MAAFFTAQPRLENMNMLAFIMPSTAMLSLFTVSTIRDKQVYTRRGKTKEMVETVEVLSQIPWNPPIN